VWGEGQIVKIKQVIQHARFCSKKGPEVRSEEENRGDLSRDHPRVQGGGAFEDLKTTEGPSDLCEEKNYYHDKETFLTKHTTQP